MNERIKELYGQAALFVLENKVGVEGVKETLQEAINEKFAELIVQECVDLAYKEGDNVAYLAHYFRGE